jgi:hypothetical protein
MFNAKSDGKKIPFFVYDSGHLTPVGTFHCNVLELNACVANITFSTRAVPALCVLFRNRSREILTAT